jgi:hypothetical protein
MEGFTQVPTMGGQSTFWYKKLEDGSLIVLIGPNKTKYIVTPGRIEIIRKRVWELDVTIRCKSSQYTDTYWPQCPSRIYSPAVAQLILLELI